MPNQVLQRVYGFSEFRPGQEAAIHSFLKGEDVVVLMPTGGGKSLCYQIPALVAAQEKRGITLVISPLISLMKDQVSALRDRGVAAAFLNSSQDLEEWRTTHSDLWNGKVDILYVSPERMASPSFRRMIRQLPIAQAAIDEAHCVSQWGHDFRKSYSKLFYLKRTLKLPIMAVTATATPRVFEDIVARLRLPDPKLIRGTFRRENLRLSLLHLRKDEERLVALVQRLRERGATPGDKGRAIVYCATRKKVESVTAHLRSKGFLVESYHAGRSDAAREVAHQAYHDGKRRILVATNAFGMGVDHPDVRLVVHFQMPGTLDAYYQEAGRAGRDGNPADCLAFFGPGDIATQKMLIRRTRDSTRERMASRLAEVDQVRTFAWSLQCRQVLLGRHFGSEHALDLIPCGVCDVCAEPDATRKRVEVERKAAQASLRERASQRSTPVSHDESEILLGFIDQLKRPESIKRITLALRGSKAKEIKRRGMHKSPGHGLLKSLPPEAIERRLEEFIAEGALERKGVKYPTVWPSGKPVRAKKGEGVPRKKKSLGSPLMDALSAYRKKKARSLRWKPYMIFTNAVIEALEKTKPSSLKGLMNISGLGEKRIERFGPEILDIIHSTADYQNDSDNG